jgi:hypothetical protein
VAEFLEKHPDGKGLITNCPHCKEIYDALMKSNVAEVTAKDATLSIVKTIVKEDEEEAGVPKKEDLPAEDQPQASVIQETLQKLLAMVSDIKAKLYAPKPEPELEAKPEAPPEEKKPAENEGEVAEEEKEKEVVSKMEKSEDNKPKVDPMPAEQKIGKVETPAAPIAPPVQPPPIQAPPPSPAPIPQPSITVETPRPGVVTPGESGNILQNFLNDSSALKKMSMKEIINRYRPR